MSTVYNLEPPTSGKVVLKTNMGDIDIELWAKEAPKACRNFVQLCMEGYYTGTIFHRIIADFLIQGGDPTGTGTGGESIYGGPFKDEFHSRLRFSHRGLVACANQNAPHTNGSQFFITLAPTESLNKKNTIFGKISGDTIYNVVRIGALDVDDNDRPFDPPVIKEVEVVWNPFDDVVPRTAAPKAAPAPAASTKPATAASGGVKKNLLSFADDAEEEEEEEDGGPALLRGGKIRAAHDVLQDERLVSGEGALADDIVAPLPQQPAKRARLEPQPDQQRQEQEQGRAEEDGLGGAAQRARERLAAGGGSGKDVTSTARAHMMEKQRKLAQQASVTAAKSSAAGGTSAAAAAGEDAQAVAPPEPSRSYHSSSDDEDDEDDGAGRAEGRSKSRGDDAPSGLAARGERFDALRKGVRTQVKTAGEVVDGELLKPYQLMREKYKSRKRVLGGRESDTLARLAQFKAALKFQDGGGGVTAEGGDSAAAGDAPRSAAGAAVKAAAKQVAGNEAGGDEGGGGGGGDDDKGYDGRVRRDLDHNAYLPASWRVDDYLAGDDDADVGLSELRSHKLSFAKATGAGLDAMARHESVDDYVVFDPLLEKSKGKFSRAAQAEKKRGKEWAGRPVT